ncbi:hypothetical protein AB0J86_20460 [Micromonospora sp. NPDC049559]|uniref:hypothetical protein n=1 Tax=Micromonospora sp. NPDC049559 TaxID=3155923 RepID=UPI00342BAB3F
MLTAARVLAENNFGDTRTGGLAGPMGLFLIVVLAVATVFLIRNMNSRLRRLPDRFPGQPGVGDAERAEAVVLDLTQTVGTEESSGSAPSAVHQDINRQSAP